MPFFMTSSVHETQLPNKNKDKPAAWLDVLLTYSTYTVTEVHWQYLGEKWNREKLLQHWQWQCENLNFLMYFFYIPISLNICM